MGQNVVCIAQGCRKRLSGKQRKFCSPTCQKRQFAADKRHNDKVEKPINRELKSDDGDYASVRRGTYYRAFVSEGYAELLANGDISVAEVSLLLETSSATVSRMAAAYKIDTRNSIAADGWEISEEAQKSLENFSSFREKYFRTELGKKYETAPFHTNWINNIIDSINNGKELLILSPPRHGKTELLIHFAVYQICKNPNLRIMWVGGNEDIAKNALSAVLDVLDTNEELREAYCPPGTSFKPDNRSGKNWSQNQFTVGTRTVTGIKSPTMVAVGKGGKILSRDCDLIIADDIEDHGTTVQPSAREQTRQWWTTTLSSRKEEHTAIVVIGSRQHPEDLYNFLLENPEMTTIVEEAHSTECVLPENDIELHTDCMLWAGKRSYKWLLSRLHAAETTGGKAIFEMVYLNKAFVDGITMFDVEEIDVCRDVNRVIGQVPAGTHLIAGLDPASTGYQACFLWAINSDTGKMYMVDIENQEGGGVIQAKQTIKKWHEMYDLSHWVIEENGFQRAIRQDKDLKDYCSRTGIYLEGHQTQKNKFDPIFGVGSMRELFREELISLPYGSAESETKSNIYRRQLIYFSTGASKQSGRNNKSDVVMASWFPMKVIRRMQKERLAEVGLDYEPSFGEWDITDMNESPWS